MPTTLVSVCTRQQGHHRLTSWAERFLPVPKLSDRSPQLSVSLTATLPPYLDMRVTASLCRSQAVYRFYRKETFEIGIECHHVTTHMCTSCEPRVWERLMGLLVLI